MSNGWDLEFSRNRAFEALLPFWDDGLVKRNDPLRFFDSAQTGLD